MQGILCVITGFTTRYYYTVLHTSLNVVVVVVLCLQDLLQDTTTLSNTQDSV